MLTASTIKFNKAVVRVINPATGVTKLVAATGVMIRTISGARDHTNSPKGILSPLSPATVKCLLRVILLGALLKALKALNPREAPRE